MKDETKEQMVLVLGKDAPGVRMPVNDGPHASEEPKWEMDWSNGREVVIQEQWAIAVYTNTANGIVIRQERGWDEDEDMVIFLSTPGAAYRVIEAIQRELDSLKQGRKG
ncbi:hypothetical protein FJ930_19670 [Mesorhizobium sp. B2-4-15]|uniref:hypothetical protein n=1 Tax=Mesorhizobium sp. B2-4-15 TaxID=2589934 RepID=UPI00114EE64B|nr:hypothetical protein [Mesorhizobium sp. B2-4-15]TPK70189.1 hypothetical protein FJ930_19670 [Mesorhizobium sp. B2-4-15]